MPAWVACLAASIGCNFSQVEGIGQFGRSIDLVRDDSELPRLLTQPDLDGCSFPAGTCESICDDSAPGACPPNSCVPILIDSGSPFTLLPSGAYALEKECVGVRQGNQGADDVSGTVSRFFFDNVQTLRAPDDVAGSWEWDAGAAPAIGDAGPRRVDVGAVMGANLLRYFAVRLSDGLGERKVTFYEQFPGDEPALADLGFAFIRLQFPGRLIGTRVNDRCVFGDSVACDLDDFLSQLGENTVFEATRMVVDSCVAPPPCAPLWEIQDDAGRRSCELRPGRITNPANAGRRCVDADDPTGGGRSASLLVATGVSGLVLFSDSAEEMFGDLDSIPPCTAIEDAETLACALSEPGELWVPGYRREQGLRRLRVRALALVEGAEQPSTRSPCTRLAHRLAAAELQCRGLDDLERPHAPDTASDLRRDEHAFVMGEAYLRAGQTTPDPDAWILTSVVPATSTIAMNLRRETGTDAIELDGILGSALLEDTDVILDYTESEDRLGVRVACSARNDPTCMSFPACTSSDPRKGENAPGRSSCCWGMPTPLVADVLMREGNDADACCETLSSFALTEVQELGACADTPPPPAIGIITP